MSDQEKLVPTIDWEPGSAARIDPNPPAPRTFGQTTMLDDDYHAALEDARAGRAMPGILGGEGMRPLGPFVDSARPEQDSAPYRYEFPSCLAGWPSPSRLVAMSQQEQLPLLASAALLPPMDETVHPNRRAIGPFVDSKRFQRPRSYLRSYAWPDADPNELRSNEPFIDPAPAGDEANGCTEPRELQSWPPQPRLMPPKR